MNSKRFTKKLYTRSSFKKKVSPPPLNNVKKCLCIDPEDRTEEHVNTIFRYLVLNSNLLEFVEKTPIIEKIAKRARYICLPKDEVLFFEGDEPDGWYMVLDGTADVIIRLFLVAEDCLFDNSHPNDAEFASLMDKMELDFNNDKLRRVNILKPGSIFGQHAYTHSKKRSATIVASSGVTEFIRFDPSHFKKFALVGQQTLYSEHFKIVKNCFQRLRDDQVENIASLSSLMHLKMGMSITSESSFGRNLYIVKSGRMARYRVVDFTPLSFRTINAPFEQLVLRFPDGMKPVHTDDLTQGSVFVDPSISDVSDSEFNVKCLTDVDVIVLDLDYFKIIVGEYEFERVKQEIKSILSDDEVIKIWVESEEARLWEKFKQRSAEEARVELKTDRLFKEGNLNMRIPVLPGSNKAWVRKTIKPYGSLHLIEKKTFAEPMEY